MNNNFKTGVLKAFAYYSVGLLTALAAYWIFGWEYKHGPGIHHLLGLLFLLGGAFWILYSFGLLLTGLKHKVNFGALTVHSFLVFGFLGYIAWSIVNDSASRVGTDKADLLTISQDDQAKTASVVNGLGDTLFLKIGDSILFNKMSKDSVSANYR